MGDDTGIANVRYSQVFPLFHGKVRQGGHFAPVRWGVEEQDGGHVGVAEKCNNKYGYQGQTFLKSKSQK